MISYFVPLDGTLKLYKLDYPPGGKKEQLYIYKEDCFWARVPAQTRMMETLRKIEEDEAQQIVEEIEGLGYDLIDGQVYMYD